MVGKMGNGGSTGMLTRRDGGLDLRRLREPCFDFTDEQRAFQLEVRGWLAATRPPI